MCAHPVFVVLNPSPDPAIRSDTASNNVSEATALVRGHDRAQIVHVESADTLKVGALVGRADVVVRWVSVNLSCLLRRRGKGIF